MFLYAAGLTTNDYRRELWLIRLMYLNTLIYPWLYVILHKESVRWFFLLVLRCNGRCCVKPRKNTGTLKWETLQVQSAILIEKYISFKVYKLYTEIWFIVHRTWSSFTSSFRCHWCHCLYRGAKQSIGVGKMGHFLCKDSHYIQFGFLFTIRENHKWVKIVYVLLEMCATHYIGYLDDE